MFSGINPPVINHGGGIIFFNQIESMKKMLLVMCPCFDIHFPPIGIALISGYLRENGIHAEVLDLNTRIFDNADIRLRNYWHPSKLACWMDQDYFTQHILPDLLPQLRDWAGYLAGKNDQIIGFSVFRSNLRLVIEIIKMIKEINPQKNIFFGGPACSIKGERDLVPPGLVDIYFVGEAEAALCELFKAYSQDGIIKKKSSAYYIEEDENKKTLLYARPIKDLNQVPFPDFREFELARYRNNRLPVLMSRGCSRRCAFCNDWVVWPQYRYRSAENVLAEISYHLRENNFFNFEFVDLAVNGCEKELLRFCDLVIARRIKINWIANFMVRKKHLSGLFEKMKQAGCILLRFGVESGSDKILKKMNKPFDVQDAQRSLAESFKAGIKNHLNIIVGFPGEGEDDFNATLSFLEKNVVFIDQIANIHPCYLTPGSLLEQQHEKYKITLPETDLSLRWTDESGSTYEERKEKAARLKEFVLKMEFGFDKKAGLILMDEELKEGR